MPEPDPIVPAAQSPLNPPLNPSVPRGENIRGSGSPPVDKAPGLSEPTGAQAGYSPGTGTQADAEDKWPSDPTRETDKKKTKSPNRQTNWLMNDPQEWVGRKVRSRRNFAIYTISEVFKTGRVKLERNWMTYLTDAQTVRTQYDSVC